MKKLCVILDNGHGKDTPGKCSPDRSLYEWQWTREITGGIYDALSREDIACHLLVMGDSDMPLPDRVRWERVLTEQAKKAGMETCLISVHINAAGGDGKWKSARGFSCWIAQSASPKSKQLAQLLYAEAEARELQGNRSVPAEKYWVAPFYITTHSSCPAVLTENLFQDNKEDVAFLLSDAGKQTIIDLHVQAIKKYIAI